jgi:hypothetical protein
MIADRAAPRQYVPWKPFSFDAAPGPATAFQIARLGDDYEACMRLLDGAGIAHIRAPRVEDGAFCSTADSVRIKAGMTPLRPAGPIMRCPLAIGTALWDRRVIQPAARRRFGVPVSAIEHYGGYACRRRGHRPDAPPSAHARANALDVAAFRLADGRRIVVARDWAADGPAGDFLRDLRDGACRIFTVTLSPDYDAAHRDHLHLDYGEPDFFALTACH